LTLRDEGGNCGDKRNVVGGVAGERGERGGGEPRVPGIVNKDAIKPHKGGSSSTVRPSVATIRQRKLNKTKAINGVVKQSCIVEGEVVVVTVAGVASEIKVPSNDPGDVIIGFMGGERL
jgi:hypothetical protein